MSETTKTRDYSQYATKAPTGLHVGLVEFIEAKTGIKVSAKDVQLAVALYADYQASPENKARAEAEKAEREAAKAAAKTEKKGGPRSPEARELKKLEQAAATLKDLDQPVPAKTTKRIEELKAIIAAATGESAEQVEVPAQAEAPVETPETVDA